MQASKAFNADDVVEIVMGLYKGQQGHVRMAFGKQAVEVVKDGKVLGLFEDSSALRLIKSAQQLLNENQALTNSMRADEEERARLARRKRDDEESSRSSSYSSSSSSYDSGSSSSSFDGGSSGGGGSDSSF